MVTSLFVVHTITETKQYAGLGRAEPGLEPGRWIFQPGHLTWRTARPGVAPPLSVAWTISTGLVESDGSLKGFYPDVF